MALFVDPDILASISSFVSPRNIQPHMLKGYVDLQKKGVAQASITYGPHHLLSLPDEILDLIWEILSQDSSRRRSSQWFARPTDEFAHLSRSCRQLYHSIDKIWPSRCATFTKFPKLVGSVAEKMRINTMNVAKIRSLSIEFRHDFGPSHYFMLARLLEHTRYLEDLSLYFTGGDKYGTPIYLHGCGLAPESGRERKLPPEGQRIGELIQLEYAVRQLSLLRKLVISNMNFPILPGMFSNKTKLKYVHLSADPRSAVHIMFPDMNSCLPLLQLPNRPLDSVEVAHVDVNAGYNAGWVLLNSTRSLKHLTWRVPDVSLDSNLTPRRDTNGHWYSITGNIMGYLESKAKKLITLRICIAGARQAPYSNRYGELIWALTGGFRQLLSLRHLEVHTDKDLMCHGPSVLDSLPPNLTRFYTNDLVTSPMALHDHVTEKYLKAGVREHPWVPLRQWSLREPRRLLKHDHRPEFAPSNETCIWMQPTENGLLTSYDDACSYEFKVMRQNERPSNRALYLSGIVGEDLRRSDYVPMRTGKLGFIAYEFSNPEHVLPTGETLTQMILRINGRLLDRERNQHLSIHGNSLNIPIYTRPRDGRSPGYGTSEQGLDAEEVDRLARVLEDLGNCGLTDNDKHEYFGNEAEAERVFLNEPSVSPDDLPGYSHPVISEGVRDEHCHWMCPEADVPTLAEHHHHDL